MENTGQDERDSIQDLLDHVEVIIACDSCASTYSVSVSIVRESHRIVAEGCSGTSPFECDALFYAGLIEPAAIEALERAWARFRQSVNGSGALGVVVQGKELRAEPPAQGTRAPGHHLHKAVDRGHH